MYSEKYSIARLVGVSKAGEMRSGYCMLDAGHEQSRVVVEKLVYHSSGGGAGCTDRKITWTDGWMSGVYPEMFLTITISIANRY